MAFYPAMVDMGASEFGPVGLPALAIHCPPSPPQVTSFVFPSLAQGASGVLKLTFGGLLRGRIALKATFKRTRTILRTVAGHRRRIHKVETLLYGQATYNAAPPPNLQASAVTALTLKPTASALKLLKRSRHLRVLLTITYEQTGLLPSTQARTITVVYKPPPRRRHGHGH
jgi:hypothetical protein